MGKNSLPPGFRFHPTDVELVKYYLKRKVLGKKLHFQAIAEVDIYKYAPWDLRDKSCLRTGDLKWYFFCPTAKRYASGARMKRATDIGYWKTTGKDRPVHYSNEVAGMIKTLVFHTGKAPKGDRTDWVMYEYRLEEKELAEKGIAQDGYVLCVIFEKEGPGPKNGAQYGAPFKEEEWDDDDDDQVEAGEEPNLQEAILPAVMGALVFVLRNNENTFIATSSNVQESTCTGPPVSSPSQSIPSTCWTLPVVSNNDVASTEAPQVVTATFSAGTSVPAFQQPHNNNNSIPATSGASVPENICYPARKPSPEALQAEAPQAMDGDGDILSLLAIFENDNDEGFDFGGVAETTEADIFGNLGDLASLETAENISNSQYLMDPVLQGRNLDFLELSDLDTPLYKSWKN